ncbi:MAG TPA: hypothetical protein VFK13_00055 [Gemmatimonadaceae bacterium]|nr:hypothetical protein [Gemmatimonadaceae bacterium]
MMNGTMAGMRAMRMCRTVIPALAIAAATPSACLPPAPPLQGAPAPAHLPSAELPPVHRTIVFSWEYEDRDFHLRGQGVARTAAPDSVRLDFFLDGGLGGGWAILVGDSLRTPRGEVVEDLLPPAPLLWAALGRLAVPPAPDTVVRVDADTLRVDIGREPRWRAALLGDSLLRLALIQDGREREWVERTGRDVRYRNARERRDLRIGVQRVDTVDGYDPAIWH